MHIFLFKTCAVPQFPCKQNRDPCKVLSMKKFFRTNVNGVFERFSHGLEISLTYGNGGTKALSTNFFLRNCKCLETWPLPREWYLSIYELNI